MPKQITHSKIATLPDEPGAEVNKAEWNDNHVISGVVESPASATDNAVARFNGATGELIQNSGVLIDDSNNITGAASAYIGSGSKQACAKLEVDTTTQGFLPPRMTNVQRDAISSPVQGLMVYDTANFSPAFYGEFGVWRTLYTPYVLPTFFDPAKLPFKEATGNGGFAVTVQAPAALPADFTVTLPSANGTLALGESIYVQNTEPTWTPGQKGLWIDTTGGNLNFWVQTGA